MRPLLLLLLYVVFTVEGGLDFQLRRRRLPRRRPFSEGTEEQGGELGASDGALLTSTIIEAEGDVRLEVISEFLS